jgi:hypothetical protein
VFIGFALLSMSRSQFSIAGLNFLAAALVIYFRETRST